MRDTLLARPQHLSPSPNPLDAKHRNIYRPHLRRLHARQPRRHEPDGNPMSHGMVPTHRRRQRPAPVRKRLLDLLPEQHPLQRLGHCALPASSCRARGRRRAAELVLGEHIERRDAAVLWWRAGHQPDEQSGKLGRGCWSNLCQ